MYCNSCKHFGFDMNLNDVMCYFNDKPCPDDFKCDCGSWVDKYQDTRCDSWREHDLDPKRHIRNKMLDKFGKYMWRKHHVWLWTSVAEPHDIMGSHMEW